MDFPYLAILWNPQIPTQQQTALRLLRYNSHANWSTAMQRDGMIVFIQMPPVPYLRTIEFCGDRGILLGVLFDRARNLPQTDSSLRKDRHFLRPDAHTARHLLEDYWGGYIALWADPQSENGWVMRDPSGMLSCYYTTYRDVTLVSSTAQSFLFLTTDCMDDSTASFALDINWPYLSGFLAYSQLQVRDTGLKSVYELLAGETLVRSPSKLAVETTWNPASYSEPRPMDDLAEHGEELRDTAQSCINAWAGLHEHVVHSLSGGFDSSLILALLAHSPRRPHLICLNRYASGPAEDERHYARIAAGTANAELIEIPWNYGHDAAFDPTVDQPLDAKPSITSLMIPLEEPFFSLPPRYRAVRCNMDRRRRRSSLSFPSHCPVHQRLFASEGSTQGTSRHCLQHRQTHRSLHSQSTLANATSTDPLRRRPRVSSYLVQFPPAHRSAPISRPIRLHSAPLGRIDSPRRSGEAPANSPPCRSTQSITTIARLAGSRRAPAVTVATTHRTVSPHSDVRTSLRRPYSWPRTPGIRFRYSRRNSSP